MKIENLKVSELVPYEKNPRRNDTAVESVAESIKQFGFQQPIVIDSQNIIIAGHTRLKAAKKLGLSSVPCVRAEELTPEQVKAYRILDNKTNELAGWDFNALADELKSFEFDFSGFEIELPKCDFNSFSAEGGNTISGFGRTPEQTAEGADYSAGLDESKIPEELRGVDLQPSALAPIKGDDATRMDRVIIVFQANQKEEVAEWLGVEKLVKVVYNFDEFQEE